MEVTKDTGSIINGTDKYGAKSFLKLQKARLRREARGEDAQEDVVEQPAAED